MAAKRIKAADDDADFSLGGTVGRLIGGAIGARSASGSAVLVVDAVRQRGDSSGMMLRKVWLPGAAPRIEFVKRAMDDTDDRGDEHERILQTIALTPANSAWAASWLVDYVEEIYLRQDMSFDDTCHLDVKLRIFDVPETTMTFKPVGFEWEESAIGIEEKLKCVRGAGGKAAAARRHTLEMDALEQAYTAGRKERLRSMARTWALVPAAAVVAAT